MSQSADYAIDAFLTNENGTYKQLPSEFYYDKIAFSDYKHTNYDNGQTIYSTLDYNISVSTITTSIKSQRPTLLTEMLNLRGKLPNNLFESTFNLVVGNYQDIPDTILSEIEKWCKRNGFPFFVDTVSKNTQKQLLKTIAPKSHFPFRVGDFIYQLNEIYSAFFLCLFLAGHIEKIPSTMYTAGMAETKTGLVKLINITTLSKDECKKLLEYKFSKIRFENYISLKNGVHFTIKTSSLFDAAFYQLALLLYVNEKVLLICPLCHECFEPEHGRQKYCKKKTCYSQLAYKRRKAQEKKLEQTNKEESL